MYSLKEQSRTLKTLLLTDSAKSLVEPHGAFYVATRPVKKVQHCPSLLIGKVVQLTSLAVRNLDRPALNGTGVYYSQDFLFFSPLWKGFPFPKVITRLFPRCNLARQLECFLNPLDLSHLSTAFKWTNQVSYWQVITAWGFLFVRGPNISHTSLPAPWLASVYSSV